MTVEMHVPNKSYDGYYGGVRFHKGIGIFEDHKVAVELAERYGYTIVETSEKTDMELESKVEETSDLEKPAPKKRTRKKAEPKAGE